MREIKFRQFFNGKFHYWGVNAEKEVDGSHFTGPLSLRDIESQQYTGLKDANGVEVYEGDILSCLGYSGVVGFDKEEPRFSVTPFGESESLALITYEMHHFSVVGNIYQNPELLK